MTDSTARACCPKCGSTAGYKFTLRESHAMNGAWGEPAEAGDSGGDVVCSLAECLECGYRCRASKAEKMKPAVALLKAGK